MTPEFFKNIYNLSKVPSILWKYKEYLINKSQLRDVSGTYGISNTHNNMLYVGSAKSLANRITEHLTNPKRSNRYFQSALKKYGKSSFIILIFETLNVKPKTEASPELKKILTKLENDLFECIPSHFLYNFLRTAYTSIGLKHSTETKELLRRNRLGKRLSESTKNKLSLRFKGKLNPFYGKTHTEESRKKIGEARKGSKHPLYNKPKSPEFMYHMTKDKKGANNPMSIPITLCNIHTKESFTFSTITEAADFVKGNRISLGRALKKGTIYKGIWHITKNSKVSNT